MRKWKGIKSYQDARLISIGSCESHSGMVMWGRGGYSGSHVGVWRAIMKGKQYKKMCSTVETYNRSNLTKLDRTLGVGDRKSGD